MTDTRSRIRHGSPRGEVLVAAWNRSDRAYVVDQLADTVTLEARRAKMPEPAPTFTLTSKATFTASLADYSGPLPMYTIVSLFEEPDTICLTLEDTDGDALAVTIELDEADKITRIISYRPAATGRNRRGARPRPDPITGRGRTVLSPASGRDATGRRLG